MLTRIKALLTVVFYLNANGVGETYPSIVCFFKTLLFASQERKKVSNQARSSNSLIRIIYLFINGHKVELTLNNSLSGIFHLYTNIFKPSCA